MEIEDPFGYDPNDLALEAFCHSIQSDVLRLLHELDQDQEGSDGDD